MGHEIEEHTPLQKFSEIRIIPPPRLTGESEEHREITWQRIAAE